MFLQKQSINFESYKICNKMRLSRQFSTTLPAWSSKRLFETKLNMSDDKKPNNSDKPKDENKKKGDKKKTRSRYEDAAISPALQKALDEQDDCNLLDNLASNPKPGGRPAETISKSAASRLQTPNETPGMIVGPQGQLYPKSEWKYIKEEYRNMMLNNPLPAIPVRIREQSPIQSSSPDTRESWSDEDPAFCGYAKLEEEGP